MSTITTTRIGITANGITMMSARGVAVRTTPGRWSEGLPEDDMQSFVVKRILLQTALMLRALTMLRAQGKRTLRKRATRVLRVLMMKRLRPMLRMTPMTPMTLRRLMLLLTLKVRMVLMTPRD
jgi:hypothetical protein